jgi:hypothetical protein
MIFQGKYYKRSLSFLSAVDKYKNMLIVYKIESNISRSNNP